MSPSFFYGKFDSYIFFLRKNFTKCFKQSFDVHFFSFQLKKISKVSSGVSSYRMMIFLISLCLNSLFPCNLPYKVGRVKLRHLQSSSTESSNKAIFELNTFIFKHYHLPKIERGCDRFSRITRHTLRRSLCVSLIFPFCNIYFSEY